jgi:hypothetical protein
MIMRRALGDGKKKRNDEEEEESEQKVAREG